MNYKYDVYITHHQYYDEGAIHKSYDEFLGTTYAASESKAINNIKFRLGIRPADLYCDTGGELYMRESVLHAKRIVSKYKKELPSAVSVTERNFRKEDKNENFGSLRRIAESLYRV